jgi:hypothetical protein
LLPFSPEPSVFPSVVKKSKNDNIQDSNFACDFVWVRNLVFDTKGGTWAEDKVLRRFGPKRDEVTGGWRKLHNEELRHLYSTPSIIRIIMPRRMRRAGACSPNGGKEKCV